ncbi:hypothetical protein AB0C14_35630 [Microbispora hainanensis]|uniref:hypothetical protein n=1 Tax=Microbispora hainanensis TaxID=568844 RepID=UPI0033D201F0
MSTSGDSEPIAPDDLESRLRALGEDLAVPPAPPPAGVARAVRARIEDGRDGGRTPRRAAWRPTPRVAAAAVAVLMAVLLGATPQGRAAVVSVLRFAGVEIHVGGAGPLPTGVPSPLPGERRVTLEEARRTARFPVMMPSALGAPADIRVADGGRVVTLLWPGVRLDEFDGTLGVVWRKELGEPWPDQVSAVGGWWIRQPHGVSYMPSGGGTPRQERVAGPTLIWQHHLVGLRLEGPDLEEAVRIARSVK